jgi:hypothetical protein
MHFGENQLSRSLIGLSPLHTDHPPGFQPWWVRSSTQSYLSFNLPMRRSLRFGSTACDSNALFRLAFATAPPHGLTSPHTITRRLILQKARSHITSRDESPLKLLRLVGTRFQVLFHDPSPGHFSPFPHGTRALSVIREYLGLPGGPGRFTQDSSSPVLLGIPSNSRQGFAYPALTVYGAPSQRLRLPNRFITVHSLGRNCKRVPRPRTCNTCRLSHTPGLASSAFAHHYSRNHCCFLFLRVLRCFTSPRYHQPPYTFKRRQHHMTGARFPHSDIPGSTSGWRLPEA